MATNVKTSTTLQLQPYIFFYGRCEEALRFYKDVFGGTYDVMKGKDTPAAAEMPPGSGDRVMHASFEGPGISFFASDGRDDKAVDPEAGNVSLAVSTDDTSEGERIFSALSKGGTVTMPLDDAFWGGRFGVIHDRFGNEWMITIGAPTGG